MALNSTTVVKRTLLFGAWAAWQMIVLLLMLVVYANLFSEYGVYSNRFVDPVVAIVFVLFALWLGTWLPLRQWRAARRVRSDNGSHRSWRH